MNFEIDITPGDKLLAPPVKRAAYSDRTAWLMSVMSLLAYVPFEAPPTQNQLLDIAKSIAGKDDPKDIVSELSRLVDPGKGKAGEVQLDTALGKIGFKLIETFDVSSGISADSQAFIAQVSFDGEHDEERQDMLVLSFRGTQPSRIADLKTDLDAAMIEVPGIGAGVAKVHRGFYTAFEAIREPVNAVLKANPELPVYITGHSLGGALALVATRFIANQSSGSCYTFGGPRACNEAFADQIFTPVYRIVNASDGVPAVPPPKSVMKAMSWVIGQIPLVKKAAPLLDTMMDYRHHGDYRHLSSAREILSDDRKKEYPGLRLRPSPTLGERWKELLRGWTAPLGNHSIELYVSKLEFYARHRSGLKAKLNPPKE